MRETADKPGTGALSSTPDSALTARVFRTMEATVALVVLASLAFAPWRVTSGLLLGGLLSLFSYHWMRTSVSAAFENINGGAKPRFKLARYVLRYFVIAAVVFAAYKLRVVSLPATVVGLCSFVVAFFVEALREVYFAIIHREETI